MINFTEKEKYNVYDLEKIIALLRSPNGCPWDMEQTHESIRRNFLEEAYEFCETIDECDTEHMCEELGDVLMQVVFHAGIEEDKGSFCLDDAADAVCRKLISRHPHVFGSERLETSGQVLDKWDEIKMKERSQQTVADAMDTVARSLPAAWRADKLISKASKAGFDWPHISSALDKLSEEVGELREAVASGKNIEGELGDVLFAAVHVAQYLNIDPEDALNKTSDKFIARFRKLENIAADRGTRVSELQLDQLEELYRIAKAEEDKTEDNL